MCREGGRSSGGGAGVGDRMSASSMVSSFSTSTMLAAAGLLFIALPTWTCIASHAMLSDLAVRCSHTATNANGTTITVVNAPSPIATSRCTRWRPMTMLFANMRTKICLCSNAERFFTRMGRGNVVCSGT